MKYIIIIMTVFILGGCSTQYVVEDDKCYKVIVDEEYTGPTLFMAMNE